MLEDWSASGDLVDKVFDAVQTLLCEALLNDEVGAQRNSLSVDLSETSLVDELGNGASSWVSVSDVWLDSSQQSGSGLVDSYEDGVVDLSESEQLKDLLLLWCNGIDTLSSDN